MRNSPEMYSRVSARNVRIGWKLFIKGGAKIDHETPGKGRFVAVEK